MTWLELKSELKRELERDDDTMCGDEVQCVVDGTLGLRCVNNVL